MTRKAAGWPLLVFWACAAAGCVVLPTLNLDPGPSADPDADPAQECLRRVVPGMPIGQARRISEELAYPFKSSGENGYSYGTECRVFESWRLDDERFLSVFHDEKKVRFVKIGFFGKLPADPGHECLRRIRPGMSRDRARWIVLEMLPDSGKPSATVICAGIVICYDTWWIDRDDPSTSPTMVKKLLSRWA